MQQLHFNTMAGNIYTIYDLIDDLKTDEEDNISYSQSSQRCINQDNSMDEEINEENISDSSESDVNTTDVPVHIFYYKTIQNTIKKLICSEAEKEGLDAVIDKYYLNEGVIEQWLEETNMNMNINTPKEATTEAAEEKIISAEHIIPENTSLDRIYTDIEELKYPEVHQEGEEKRIIEQDPGAYTPPVEDQGIESNSIISNESNENNSEFTDSSFSSGSFIPSTTFPKRKRKQRNIQFTSKYIFAKLSPEEKEKILYEYLASGSGFCMRKYGIRNRGTIYNFSKTYNLFDKDDAKAEKARKTWKLEHHRYIQKKMNTQRKRGLDALVDIVRTSIKRKTKRNKPCMTVSDLCKLALDKGLAVAASKFNTNLFTLEFLIEKLFPTELEEMESNEWFLISNSVNQSKIALRSPEVKLEIIQMAKAKGRFYTCRRFRVADSTIFSYTQLYKKYGMKGLANDKEHSRIKPNSRNLEISGKKRNAPEKRSRTNKISVSLTKNRERERNKAKSIARKAEKETRVLNHNRSLRAVKLIKAPTLPKYESVGPLYKYTTLQTFEKERILFDYFQSEMELCKRKWGFYNGLIHGLIKTFNLSSNKEKNPEWMKRQRLSISRRFLKLKKLGIQAVKKSATHTIKQSTTEEKLNIKAICKLGLEKGIAITAVKYSLNLFQLEFLIKNIIPEKWKEMEENDWYLTPMRGFLQNDSPFAAKFKLDIVECARSEGILFASKKYHLAIRTICSYIHKYKESGTSK